MAKIKSSNISKSGEASPTKIGVHPFLHQPLFAWILWIESIWIYFLTPMDYLLFEREIQPNLMVASNISETERLYPPKLVFMHLTSTPTYISIILFNQFFTTMDYSPWSEWKFSQIWKLILSPKLKKATPMEIAVHVFDIHPYLYLHEFLYFIQFFSYHGPCRSQSWPLLLLRSILFCIWMIVPCIRIDAGDPCNRIDFRSNIDQHC